MKRIISLLMAVLMLCALCVPALAEEDPDDEYSRGIQLETEGKYEEAAEAFCAAVRLYEEKEQFVKAADAYCHAGGAYMIIGDHYNSRDYASAVDAYMKAGECYAKAASWHNAAVAYSSAALMRCLWLGKNDVSCTDAYMRAGNCYLRANEWNSAAESFEHVRLFYEPLNTDFNTVCAVMQGELNPEGLLLLSDPASEFDFDAGLLARNSAAAAYLGKSIAYRKMGDNSSADDNLAKAEQILMGMSTNGVFNGPLPNGFFASTLSEGSLAIVCTVAGLAVGFLAATFIFKKKKPEERVES